MLSSYRFVALAFSLVAVGCADGSSITVAPESGSNGATGSPGIWSGRVVSDPPGIDCVLGKDGKTTGTCSMTLHSGAHPTMVSLSGQPDPGSQLVAWVNTSNGSSFEGEPVVGGPKLSVVANPGKDYSWAAAFGPAPER
jgi:hypothetical protein